VKFRDGGDTYQVDSRTREFVGLNQTVYHRYMVNYFSLGMDAKIGTGFEMKRTGSRRCNLCCYFCVGLKNFFCNSCLCCADRRVIDMIEYVKCPNSEESFLKKEQGLLEQSTIPNVLEASLMGN